MITQEKLKELFHYDHNTGFFTRKIARSNVVKAGEIVGHKDANRRITTRIDGVLYGIHRLAWLYHYGDWPTGHIDHINHDPSDNRIKNLRDVTNKENNRNFPRQKNNKSGVTGVYFDNSRTKWAATIKVNYKSIGLGRFETLIDAVAARKRAEKIYGFHENHGKNIEKGERSWH